MKNSFKSVETVKEVLLLRKEKLEKILETKKPKDKSKQCGHERRINNAIDYLSELESVLKILEFVESDIDIVPLETLNKQLDGADYCSLIFDEDNIILAEVSNNPFSTEKRFKDFFIMWMKPLKQL